MRRLRSLGIATAAGILVMLLLAAGVMDTLELPARDLVLRLLPEKPARIARVIAIDEASLRTHGAWPWPRTLLAAIVERAAQAGARGVVLDVLLSEPRTDDVALARAMTKVPTFAVCVLIEGEQWLLPSSTLRDSARVAHGNFELDHDGILRRFSPTKQSGDRAFTALSLEVASLLRPATVPLGRSISPAFRTPPSSVPVLTAGEVLGGRADLTRLRGSLVFVGPTALGLGDRVLTPVSRALSPDPGVTVHAAATESLLRNELVHPLPPIAGGALSALFVTTMLFLRRRARILRIGGFVAGLTLILAGGAVLLASTGIAIPFVSLVLAIAATLAVLETIAMTTSVRESRVALVDQKEIDLESKRLLAHELKTPIASMRNLTQLLAGFELSAAERQRVAVLLQSEAGKLETMVQALLDLERLSMRDFGAAASVVDLSAIVSGRIAVLGPGRPQVLQSSIEPGVLVLGDALLLERVIDNLVGNAMKYTPTQATVLVRLRREHGQAIVDVADTGPGIPATERERVFQRFYRGVSAQGTEGLGLGLAFVADVARWHGGRVTVENQPGGGALFQVIVPLAAKER